MPSKQGQPVSMNMTDVELAENALNLEQKSLDIRDFFLWQDYWGATETQQSQYINKEF